MSEYPDEQVLEHMRNYDLLRGDMGQFLELIRENWWSADWGYKLTGKRVLRLELHTGGWSGNEEVISALQRNFIFWAMCWRKTEAGGHYYFRIEVKR